MYVDCLYDFFFVFYFSYSMRIPPVIRTMPEVKSKIELLEALSDIEFAVNILKNNQSSTENIIDVNYERLNCDIKPLRSTDPMYSVRITHTCIPNCFMYLFCFLNCFNE